MSYATSKELVLFDSFSVVNRSFTFLDTPIVIMLPAPIPTDLPVASASPLDRAQFHGAHVINVLSLCQPAKLSTWLLAKHLRNSCGYENS